MIRYRKLSQSPAFFRNLWCAFSPPLFTRAKLRHYHNASTYPVCSEKSQTQPLYGLPFSPEHKQVYETRMCVCTLRRISRPKEKNKRDMASEAQNGELYAVRINYEGYNAPPLLPFPHPRCCNAIATASYSSKLNITIPWLAVLSGLLNRSQVLDVVFGVCATNTNNEIRAEDFMSTPRMRLHPEDRVVFKSGHKILMARSLLTSAIYYGDYKISTTARHGLKSLIHNCHVAIFLSD